MGVDSPPLSRVLDPSDLVGYPTGFQPAPSSENRKSSRDLPQRRPSVVKSGAVRPSATSGEQAMRDADMTREQLIGELTELRQQVEALKATEAPQEKKGSDSKAVIDSASSTFPRVKSRTPDLAGGGATDCSPATFSRWNRRFHLKTGRTPPPEILAVLAEHRRTTPYLETTKHTHLWKISGNHSPL